MDLNYIGMCLKYKPPPCMRVDSGCMMNIKKWICTEPTNSIELDTDKMYLVVSTTDGIYKSDGNGSVSCKQILFKVAIIFMQSNKF